MSFTLLLHVPDLPRFDAATPAAWTLLDNADAVLRSGEGPLASVPRAERVVALAPVGHLLFIETTLPPVSPAKRDALLRYAIEDMLTIDPSTVHAVVLGQSDTHKHVVAAIDRSWLVGVLHWLKQAGLAPDSLISSAAGIPVAAGEWVVLLDGQRGFAKRADGFVYNLDLGAGREPPFGLTLALKEAREQQVAPAALVLQSMPSRTAPPPVMVDAMLARQWENVLGLPVRLGLNAAIDPQRLVAVRKSANLLSGEFTPREAIGKWLELLRPTLAVIVIMLVVHIVFTLVDNGRLNGERRLLEQQMTQVFKAAFPAAQAIVDPPLQMRRNLQQLKRERGVAADTDPQMLIAGLAALLQSLPGAAASIVTLSIRDGIATLDAVLADDGQRAALQRAVDRLPGATLGIPTDAAASPLAVRVSLRAGT